MYNIIYYFLCKYKPITSTNSVFGINLTETIKIIKDTINPLQLFVEKCQFN